MVGMHDKFMKTAFLFADESKCVSYHVGAVIVKDKRIISIGYNGTPPGLPNCCEVFNPNNFSRNKHHIWSKKNEIHAEMNSLMFAAKTNIETEGADMYVTTSPCNDCLKNISAAGIRNIYYLYLYDKEPLNPEILKVVNVQEVPGAKEIREFVEKNNLNYITRERFLQQELKNSKKSYFKAIISKVTTEEAEIKTEEYFIRRPLDGKKFRVVNPGERRDISEEVPGSLIEENGEIVFKVEK